MDKSKITWGLGVTLNLGNFQSLRIDLEVDGYPIGDETVREASDRIYKFVETELEAKAAEARKEIDD